MAKENDWINNLKVGDTIFIQEYRMHSKYAKNSTETISKIGRKYITTNKNRMIEIATGHERSKVTGSLVAQMYQSENEYLKEIELNRKHRESIEFLKNTKTKECIEAVYEVLTENNGWISVNERLPQQGLDVLFYVPTLKNGRKGIDYGCLDDGSNGVLCFVGTDYGFDLPSVTHWQPLPKPPKEK